MVILLFACILSRHNGWVCKIFTLNCLLSLLESEANINRVRLIGLRNFASDSLAMFCFTEGIHNLVTKFHKAVYQDFRGGEHHHFKQLERKAEKKTLCFKRIRSKYLLLAGVKGNNEFCFHENLSVKFEVKRKQNSLFPAFCYASQLNTRSPFLDAGWHTNLPRFQRARPDHLRVEISSRYFPREF